MERSWRPRPSFYASLARITMIACYSSILGPDLKLKSVADPLLAPVERCDWKPLWSSEQPCYFGGGDIAVRRSANASLLSARPRRAGVRGCSKGNIAPWRN